MRTEESAPYKINATFLDDVERYVDWSLAQGMITVLNTHHEKWLDDPSAFEAKLPRFEAIWTQIAERFKDKNETLLFEIFNEPNRMTTDQLNTMTRSIMPIIRKNNPSRIVLFMGLQFGNPRWILNNPDSLYIPDDKQIMLEIHNYDPYKYAGANPTQHSWGSDADRAALTEWVDNIDAWRKQKGLAIFYGEWGLTNQQTVATGRDDWFKAHADAIQSKQWAGCVWNDGGGHLIFNYDNGTWVEDIVKALGK